MKDFQVKEQKKNLNMFWYCYIVLLAEKYYTLGTVGE